MLIILSWQPKGGGGGGHGPMAQPKNSEPAASPPIIVRFLSRDVGNQLYATRKLARTANLREFSLQGAENIYINENLTQSRKSSSGMLDKRP